MLVTYFDEVKPSHPDQPYYWLGGLAIDDAMIPGLEQEVNALAVTCFGAGSGLTKQTEFHATDIASGRGNFKKARNPVDRFNVLKRLIAIYDKPDGVFRITVRLDVNKLYSSVDVEELALMYFIEKANSLARRKATNTLLIGDYEKEKTVSRAVRNLATYKKDGTPYAFGQDIHNTIDTVHFAHSHRRYPQLE